ncbi:lipocalin-like domain-containing protein [Agrobacterium tumefaciens]|nr:lipocalin-like domain-containing protein [Agrobacterium tumefaciens]
MLGTSAVGLREKLIGAWKLVSYEERPVDGSPTIYPMTKTPKGIIMYTPDGYMSAQLMTPGRAEFASGDWFDATPEEYREEATGYIAYSGPFDVDEEQGSLTHSMFVSLFPNWIGQTQPRVVFVTDKLLSLSTASPIKSGGREVMSYLTWQKASRA